MRARTGREAASTGSGLLSACLIGQLSSRQALHLLGHSNSTSSQDASTDRPVSFRPEILSRTRRKIETHSSMQVVLAAPARGEVSQRNSVSSFATGMSQRVPSFTSVRRVLLAVQQPAPLNQ